jgi:hypothetical protein
MEQRNVLLHACRSRLEQLRQAYHEQDIRHFCATLVFAVISDAQVIAGSLGDGFLAVLNDDGDPVLVLEPDRPYKESRTTYFVVSHDAHAHLRLRVLPASADAVFVAMLSDGSYTMFSNRGNYDPIATVREVQYYIDKGDIADDEDLADAIDQMAEYPYERLDDWSVLVWSARTERVVSDSVIPVRSMLSSEEQKYAALNENQVRESVNKPDL